MSLLKILFTLVFIFLSHLTHSQTIVVSDSISFNTFESITEYRTIDIGQCESDYIDQTFARKTFDILSFQDGDIYGYGITQGSNSHHFWGVQSGAANYDYLNTDQDKEGWTCDEYGSKYSAGKGVTKVYTDPFFLANDTEQYLGDLPPGMECRGGLTYRQGKFYLHSISNQLVEVNIKDPMQSKAVMDFPPGILPIDALTTVQVGCDSSVTYAIGRAPHLSKVYEIDFGDWTLTEICELPLSINGAGAQTECMLPPCDIFIDLDNDNSSFGFRGDHCVDTFCVPPVMVSDTDVVIFSASGMVESVTLQLEGMLDIGEEHLTVGMANNITVTGDGTPFLTLENNGNATVADFEEAVGTVLYDNSAVATTFGMRRVLVTAFAAGESSLVSVAELPLSNERMRTVAVTTDPTCHGLSDGSIGVSSEGGVGQYLYQWEIPQQGDSVEDLSAGIYPFVVTDSLGCTKRDTVFLHDPDTLVADISYSGHYSICDSSGLLTATASGGSGGLSYSWDNGVTDSINTGVGAGDYTLTVQDTNGCTATAFHAIPFGPAVYETRYDTICENEPVLWYGDLFASDTFTCQAFLLENGCDSFHCLSLSVRPSPSATIITDGDFCETDEIALSVGNHEAYLWSTGGTDAQIDISDVGNYSVTVTNGYGCTASASIIIDPPISFDLMFKSPSCHGDRDGEIVFANTTGGSPPYLYSIDGGNQFHTDGQFGNLPAGGYGTVVTDADGCSMTTPVELVQPSAVTVEAGDDREIDLGEGIALDGFTNLADPVVAWHPTDGLDCPTCLQTDGRPFMSIQYVLEVVDSNGCTASDVVNVVVNDRSDTYAPNVFSPNGDGINDYFIVHTGTSITDVLSLKVFDRWGGTVFSAAGLIPNKIETGWPGAVKGEPAQEGVYVYIAELQKVNGEVEVVSGEVLLIR